MPARDIEQLRRLCKERGFVFPGSAAYGGVASFWDYGPLGVEMLNNIKKAWWQDTVYAREDMEGLDAAVLMSRKVWQHSGHEATFSDPLVDNKKTKKRYRLDHLLVAQKTPTLLRLVRSSSVWKWIEANRSRADCQQWEVAFKAWNSRVRQTSLGFDAEAIDEIEQADRILEDNVEKFHRTSLVNEVVYPLVRAAGATGQDLTESTVVDPSDMQAGDWTDIRHFNLMFRTHVGPVEVEHYSQEIAQADKLTFEAIAPEYADFLASDTSLSEEDKKLRRATVDAWKYRIDQLELAIAKGDDAARVYLRPETAQGIFMNFAHVQRSMARKVPFGVAQIGKAFRNEITPGNFIFRTREFEQMEIEFFVKPPQFVKEGEKTDEQWHAEWIEQRFKWWLQYATSPAATGEERDATAERFRARAQAADELAHYAKATTDIEYLFPGALGWGEIEGVANRTDFDLSAHSKDVPAEDLQRLKLEANADSVEKFDYFDPDAKARYIPWVIEPSAGATRAMLTFLCEAYHEEVVKEPTKQQIDQVKSDAAMITKNAEKKIKEAIKAGAEAKHDPALVQAFLDTFNEVVSRLPASLGELVPALDHPGAANLEPVKKFRPPTEKMVEECMRTVMRLHPALAPIKLAVFPLAKNKPELVDLARSIKAKFQRHFRVVYDQSAGIGKLYRRQDEIGTPFCITVDHQSLEDGSVTVRERDSMAQERVAIDALSAYLLPRLQG